MSDGIPNAAAPGAPAAPAPAVARSIPALVLVTCAALVFCARLHTVDEPLERDVLSYIMQTRELAAGARLYVDVLEIKPPAIYATWFLAEKTVGTGIWGIFAVNFAFSLAILAAVFSAARSLAGTAAGCAAAVAWTLIGGEMLLQANQPNIEQFLNAGIAGFVALLLAADRAAGWRARGLLLAAALCAIYATMLKQHTLLLLAALGAGWLFAARSDGPALRRRASQLALILAAGLAAWGALLGYFAAQGRLDAFVEHVATIAFHYGKSGGGLRAAADQSLLGNLLRGATVYLFPLPMLHTGPAVVLAIVGIALGAGGRTARWLLVAWAAGAFVQVTLPGRYFPHYYQLYLPAIAIGAALGWHALARFGKPVAAAVGAATLAVIAARVGSEFAAPAARWSRAKYGDLFVEVRRTAFLVDELLHPSENVYVWGSQPGLYYYAERRPPTEHFWPQSLLYSPWRDRWTTRALRDLDRARPELILIEDVSPTDASHPVMRWMSDHYLQASDLRLSPRFPDALVKKGGRLERELRARGLPLAPPAFDPPVEPVPASETP